MAERYAEVEYDAIPGCSGLILGLDGRRPKPLILVNSAENPDRQRFTVAHELGHYLMPWHLGTGFYCDTTDRHADLRPKSADEPEANRFAAELLVPSAWLDGLIAERTDRGVKAVFEEVLAAEVSSWVAAFRLAERLPGGHIFSLVDGANRVIISGETEGGPRIGAPLQGAILDRTQLDRFASNVEEVKAGGRKMVWWTFRDVPGEVETPEGSAALLLDELCQRYGSPSYPAQKLKESMAGVIGYANSGARKRGETDSRSLYALFRSRFAKARELPSRFLEDPDFDRWLRLRANELGDPK